MLAFDSSLLFLVDMLEKSGASPDTDLSVTEGANWDGFDSAAAAAAEGSVSFTATEADLIFIDAVWFPVFFLLYCSCATNFGGSQFHHPMDH